MSPLLVVPPPPPGTLEATPPDGATIDFGQVGSDDGLTLPAALTLTNTGGAGTLVDLTGATFSTETQPGLFSIAGDDATADLAGLDLSETFDLAFDATGLAPGLYGALITLHSDTGDLSFSLTAEVLANQTANIPEPTTATLLLAAMILMQFPRKRSP